MVPVIQILDLSGFFFVLIVTAEHAAGNNMDTEHATDQYHVYFRESVIERQHIKKNCTFGIHETRVL